MYRMLCHLKHKKDTPRVGYVYYTIHKTVSVLERSYTNERTWTILHKRTYLNDLTQTNVLERSYTNERTLTILHKRTYLNDLTQTNVLGRSYTNERT